MTYLVLYSDDHCDIGGHGWEYFDDIEAAQKFITERMEESGKGLEKYEVFKGDKMQIIPVEKITKIQIQ